MIFVTVGTWHIGYDRLLRKIDELASAGFFQEKLVAQVGNSRYRPTAFEVMDFCSPEEFERLVSESRIVVTHAGVGSMMTAILNDRPVIVLPRKSEEGEAIDNHQFNTARQFEQEGLILVAYDEEQIEAKLVEAESFKPSHESAGLETIQNYIHDYIQALAKSRA